MLSEMNIIYPDKHVIIISPPLTMSRSEQCYVLKSVVHMKVCETCSINY